ncbi:MAG: enoyl-CoA hydratase-related protein [Intestinimonas sp.]|nr:enoyl-CoA hydratase-related protein [Intestinimonas sp.]
MKKYSCLDLQYEEKTAVVILNHPPVNAISARLIDDLEQAFLELEQNSELRAVVLASALQKIFVAGADVGQFVNAGAADNYAIATRGHQVLKRIETFTHPVICAINGIAYGGGLEMALACDLRVMDKRAKVGFPESGLGIIPGYGGTQRLTHLVGAGAARRLLYTGRTVGAEEAGRIGLAEVVSEAGGCLAEAKKLAAQICEKAPLAVSADKKCVRFALEHPLSEGLDYEAKLGSELFETKDKTEGMTAFLEKREPVFLNR